MNPGDRRALVRVSDATKLKSELAMTDSDGVKVPATLKLGQEAKFRQEFPGETLTARRDAKSGGPGIRLQRLRARPWDQSCLRLRSYILHSGSVGRGHTSPGPLGVHGAPDEKPRQQDHSNHVDSMSPVRVEGKGWEPEQETGLQVATRSAASISRFA